MYGVEFGQEPSATTTCRAMTLAGPAVRQSNTAIYPGGRASAAVKYVPDSHLLSRTAAAAIFPAQI